MTNTPATTAQPGEKPAYVPPRVMRLGDLNEGAGACAAGSGVVTGNCDPSGANATVSCTAGGTADTGACNTNGGTAGDVCSLSGSDAQVGCQNSGSNTNGTGACNGVGGNPL